MQRKEEKKLNIFVARRSRTWHFGIPEEIKLGICAEQIAQSEILFRIPLIGRHQEELERYFDLRFVWFYEWKGQAWQSARLIKSRASRREENKNTFMCPSADKIKIVPRDIVAASKRLCAVDARFWMNFGLFPCGRAIKQKATNTAAHLAGDRKLIKYNKSESVRSENISSAKMFTMLAKWSEAA